MWEFRAVANQAGFKTIGDLFSVLRKEFFERVPASTRVQRGFDNALADYGMHFV